MKGKPAADVPRNATCYPGNPSMKRTAITFACLLTISLASLRAADPATAAQQQQQDQIVRAIREVQEQQAAIAENQTKIESKVAAIAELVRQARIYAARGGSHPK